MAQVSRIYFGDTEANNAKPLRLPEVSVQIEALEKSAAQLSEVCEVLLARLAPVMRSEARGDVDFEKVAGALSPMAQRLSGLNASFDNSQSKLNLILTLLEI